MVKGGLHLILTFGVVSSVSALNHVERPHIATSTHFSNVRLNRAQARHDCFTSRSRDPQSVVASGSTVSLRGGAPDNVNPYKFMQSLSIPQQNVAGVLAVLLSVAGQVEIIGKITDRSLLPTIFSRKLTHIFVGSSMVTCMSLFPIGNSGWGRLGVCAVGVMFMIGFALAAYIPDDDFKRLPAFLRHRIQRLVFLCRSPDRIELMGGTFFYCVMVAQLVILSWTSPLNVISFSALFLGDGLADPFGRWLGKNMQFRVAWFGPKSLPGSAAFFMATMIGSLLWGRLFQWAGHWGPEFNEPAYLKAAGWCAAAATLAEALSPPQVDNLVIVMACSIMGHCMKCTGIAPFLMDTLG